jgi:hypothetical protein
MLVFTYLVKSIKYGGYCICFYNSETKRWIRPIKPGSFIYDDLLMDNGEPMSILDVVDFKLGKPAPRKHHVENFDWFEGTKIKFVEKLSDKENSDFLNSLSDKHLLDKVESKYELYEMIAGSQRSVVLVGPIAEFGIGYGNHPKIWFIKDGETVFSLPCTDHEFCDFAQNMFENSGGKHYFNSSEVDELKDKEIYLVIGLTGDSIKENGEIRDGRFSPDEENIPARYWPMVVSVITVPSYH